MTDYNCLVVAPDTDLLLVKDEVMQVVNLLGAKLLQGSQANIHGLLNILSEPFDIIWFATHGNEKGIFLSDGLINTSEITTMTRSVGASLVVFNTCSSRSVALTIHDELRIQFVCTVKEIPDRTAFVTGTVFARKIAAGLSFREAYEAAKPGQNQIYLFLPEEREPFMPVPERDRQPKERIDDDLVHLHNLVRRLEIIVTGSTDYNVRGLTVTVNELVEKVNDMADDLISIKSNQRFNRNLLIGVTVLSVLLLFAILIVVYQQNLAG